MADEKKIPQASGPKIAENTVSHIGSPTAPNAPVVEHPVVQWKAIFAGAFIALLSYYILMSLGLAIGSANIQGAIQGDDTLSGFGAGAAVWTVLSILISLFVGSYAAGRVSGWVPIRVGRIEGAVVAALFFGFVVMQAGSIVGRVGNRVGSAVGALGGTIGDVASNPQVQEVVSGAIGDLNLKSPPDVIIQGVVGRLIRGDEQGAVTYLSRETGVSEVEARARIDRVSNDVQQAAARAGATAASVLKFVGWTLFVSLFLGTLVSILGGGLGSRSNLRTVLEADDRKALSRNRAA